MKVVCFYLYQSFSVIVLMCVVSGQAFATSQLNQVAFQTDWLEGTERDEYVRIMQVLGNWLCWILN